MSPQVKLSVVVPTRNRAERLELCLASLLKELGDGDEVIVADSASSDPAVAAVARRAGVGYVRCARPGTALARNTGWRATHNSVIAFIDDDVTVAPGWADGLRRAFAIDPPPPFVFGRIEVPPGQEAMRPIAVKDDPDPQVIDANFWGCPGHGANMALDRAALEAVGGFDERFGPGARYRAAEDQDLVDRLVLSGRVGAYEPAVAAWHDQWRSHRALLRTDWQYGVGSGARLVRLMRDNRGQVRAAARMSFWDWGLQGVLRNARSDQRRFLAATATVRVMGVLAGMVIAAPRRR